MEVARKNGRTATQEEELAAPGGPQQEEMGARRPKEPDCWPPDPHRDITAVLRKIKALRHRPLFVLVSRSIDNSVCEAVYRWRKELSEAGKDDNLDILIHSPGGILTECYRIAKLFSRYTNDWEALVPSYGMSGATLICLGSSKIILSDIAMLGPIDPQVMSKRPSKFFITERQSPLEAFQALTYMQEVSLRGLDAAMLLLLKRYVAPQTALEAASDIAMELVKPVLEKIDPYDLGAFRLDATLSSNYCERICRPNEPQKRAQRNADHKTLVEQYPAHEFVIDAEEAQVLGLNVCRPDEELEDLFDELREHLDKVELYVGLITDEEEQL